MGLTFKKTITKWDEGIPLGNGHLGALIWGKAEALRFSLDRADIWDLTPHPRIFEGDFTYQTMVQLVKEGKEEAISHCKAIIDALTSELSIRGGD